MNLLLLQKNITMETGIKNELEIIVTAKDTALAYGSGLIEVFATPAMVALMEKTALQLVGAHLEKGKNTVGTEISVKHVKATPIGKKVKAYAKLTEIKGSKLTFEVEAYDENGLIGIGIHKRFIIDEKAFMENLS